MYINLDAYDESKDKRNRSDTKCLKSKNERKKIRKQCWEK